MRAVARRRTVDRIGASGGPLLGGGGDGGDGGGSEGSGGRCVACSMLCRMLPGVRCMRRLSRGSGGEPCTLVGVDYVGGDLDSARVGGIADCRSVGLGGRAVGRDAAEYLPHGAGTGRLRAASVGNLASNAELTPVKGKQRTSTARAR